MNDPLNTTPAGDREAILRAFGQILGDAQRLIIAGRLAVQPQSLGELGESLQLTPEQARQQVDALVQAGLVRIENGRFMFNDAALETWAEVIHAGETKDKAGPEIEAGDAFERKVLRDFLRADGTIKAFPAQEKKFLVIVCYALQVFEPGVRYTEKQANEYLRRYHADTALLRRSMIDHRYMTRQEGIYWRLES
jgi:hypothetical protein